MIYTQYVGTVGMLQIQNFNTMYLCWVYLLHGNRNSKRWELKRYLLSWSLVLNRPSYIFFLCKSGYETRKLYLMYILYFTFVVIDAFNVVSKISWRFSERIQKHLESSKHNKNIANQVTSIWKCQVRNFFYLNQNDFLTNYNASPLFLWKDLELSMRNSFNICL